MFELPQQLGAFGGRLDVQPHRILTRVSLF